MTHLDPEELLDLAEGVGAEATQLHLASCERCRGQVAELRAAMSVVALRGADDVPEPSPLFWEHFSARVHEAIAAEGVPQTASWAVRWMSWKAAVPAACAALLVMSLAAAITYRPSSPAPSLTTVEDVASAIVADGIPVEIAAPTDDPSWSLMANLAGDLDWDDAVEAGLTSSAGSVDLAIYDLSADERRELQRLLKEELARPGV